MELNRLFEGAFEACAGEARGAIEALEPLMQACADQASHGGQHAASAARGGGVRLADGVHRRLCNVYQVLLVRFDLDRSYLDTVGQSPSRDPAAGHTEVLEPALMLSMIGWARDTSSVWQASARAAASNC